MKTLWYRPLEISIRLNRDRRGGFHCLKRIHTINDHIIVIYVIKNDKGYIKTEYFTSMRRYRWLE